jgi:hypothetical protein
MNTAATTSESVAAQYEKTPAAELLARLGFEAMDNGSGIALERVEADGGPPLSSTWPGWTGTWAAWALPR